MVNSIKTSRRNAFNFYQQLAFIFLVITTQLSCSSISGKTRVISLAEKAALKVAQPELEKIFLAESPILPSSRSQFPLVNLLPGKSDFKPLQYKKSSLAYAADGTILLTPGDYNIPVITYCMKSNGASPPGHTYALSLLQGTRAKVIRELNMKAIPQFTSEDVQILSWSLQAGLNYEELTTQSKKIVDAVIPNDKIELQDSFFHRFTNEWDRLAVRSQGILPSFNDASDEFLMELGDVGKNLIEMRAFRDRILENGNDYEELSRFIDVKKTPISSTKTAWSKVSDQVYARFVTKYGFQEVGEIQVRILPFSLNLKRSPNSISNEKVLVDLSSWVADPQNSFIQPLTFSVLMGSDGVLLVSELLETPLIAAAVLGSILAADFIDWDAFLKLRNYLSGTEDRGVNQLIAEGIITLNKRHDELEKPARDVGVIDERTEKIPGTKEDITRQYIKPGGEKALQDDFDRFPVEATKASDGTEVKILPDGRTVVKRPVSEKNPIATLEIQPPQGVGSRASRLRIKVRYK